MIFTFQVYHTRKETQKKVTKKHKRTWTYEDENGNDLGQDYDKQLQTNCKHQKKQQKKSDDVNVRASL